MKQQGTIRWMSGQWYVQFRTSLVVDGKQVCKQIAKQIQTEQEYRTEPKRVPQEVVDGAASIMKGVNGCTIAPTKRCSLDEFFRHVYLVNVEGEKKPSTLAGYKTLFNQQISPRCGSEYLKDFDTPRLQRFLRQVSTENPTLKRTTMRNIRCLMSAIFRHAIQQGYATGVNPVRETSSPLAPDSADTYAYSLDEVLAIMRELNEPARTICAIAAFAGLRRSEIQGLTWEPYLASAAESVRVERSFVNGAWGEPKTKSSRAWVPVIPPLQRLLNAHRIRCGSPTSGLMFATGKGTPLCLNNILCREILPALNRCKICNKAEHETNGHAYEHNPLLPAWRGWHAFRRGLATNLHDLGVDDMTIQKVLPLECRDDEGSIHKDVAETDHGRDEFAVRASGVADASDTLTERDHDVVAD